MRRHHDSGDETDEHGFDYDPSVFSRGLDAFVPAALARWALSVDVTTDKNRYRPNEPVEIEITIRNRLPVPISLRISGVRIWGWRVDGHLEAREESLYVPEEDRSLDLRAGESRTFDRTWRGRILRDGDDSTRWHEVSAGEHEIAAFVATDPPVEDSTTIEIR